MSTLANDSRGGDYGAVQTNIIMGGSLGPTDVGIVGQIASFRIAFVGLVGCLLTSFAIMGWFSLSQSDTHAEP